MNTNWWDNLRTLPFEWRQAPPDYYDGSTDSWVQGQGGWALPDGYELDPGLSSKYGFIQGFGGADDAVQAADDGSLVMRVQQPGMHKYDTADLRYTKGADGKWNLDGDAMARRQISSHQQTRDAAEQVATMAAIAAAMYYGGGALMAAEGGAGATAGGAAAAGEGTMGTIAAGSGEVGALQTMGQLTMPELAAWSAPELATVGGGSGIGTMGTIGAGSGAVEALPTMAEAGLGQMTAPTLAELPALSPALQAAGGTAAANAARNATDTANAANTMRDVGRVAVPLVGAAIGANDAGKDNTASQTTQSKLDPRMQQYLYGADGSGGLLGAAMQRFQTNQGINPTTQQGLAMQKAFYSSPQYAQGYGALRDQGMGLLRTQAAGNPFTTGQGAGLLWGRR